MSENNQMKPDMKGWPDILKRAWGAIVDFSWANEEIFEDAQFLASDLSVWSYKYATKLTQYKAVVEAAKTIDARWHEQDDFPSDEISWMDLLGNLHVALADKGKEE